MPRKARNAPKAPAAPPVAQISSLVSSTPLASSPPSLLHALEHIPPAPPRSTRSDSGDLTPPPELVQGSKEGMIQERATELLKERKADNNIPSSPLPQMTEEKKQKLQAKRTPKKAKVEATSQRTELAEIAKVDSTATEPQAVATETTPAKVTPKKRAAKKAAIIEEDDDYEENSAETPKKRAKKTPKVKEEDGADEDSPEGKPKRKPTPKKSRIAQDETEFDEDGNEIIKKKRKPRVYPKIEYDIPPVERKETNFKGRLGYACLNTVLRGTKPDSIFCSRTCRIASIEEEGLELPKGLARMNVRDLKVMVEWNEQNKIRFMRLSSEMFPFASHEKYGYDLSFVADELKEIGDLAKKYGHRLTMHPGQFTQLGSPKEGVIKASIRELNYQCEIMDRMGLDQDGVMIIHMGGVYGDKPSTLARFKENYANRLSDNVKARLVLENDEICYNVDDLMPVCNELDIPIIFDYHHDWINPSCEPPGVLIPKIAEMWKKKGIKMKQHLSEPRPGAESVMERRAHADRCKSLPPDLPEDVDLMIEAKDKEQAVFELYRIYGLEDVIQDNLRPPDPSPSMQTKGRKSSLKKKVKDTGEVDSDGEPIQLSDIEKEGDGGIGDEGSVGAREVKTEESAKTPKNRGAKGTPAGETKPKNGRKKAAELIKDVADEIAAEVKEEQLSEVKKEEQERIEMIEEKKPAKRSRKKVTQVA